MKAILARPRFDEATQYCFDFATEIIAWCQQAGIDLVELAEGDAIREKIEAELAKGTDIYTHYDHGGEEYLYGQDAEPAICKENCKLLAGIEVYTLACLSAKKLGKEVWKRGGKYWGYTVEVGFSTDALPEFQRAFNCGFHYLFIEGDKENALERAKQTFTDMALELISSGGTFAAIIMRNNSENLVYYDSHGPEEGEEGQGCLIGLLKLPKAFITRRRSEGTSPLTSFPCM